MGGRPAQLTVLRTAHESKADKRARAAAEDALKGGDTLVSPDWMNERQKEIFAFVVDSLEPLGFLGSLDTPLLTQFAVAVDRLEYIDKLINAKPETMKDKRVMAARAKYMNDFTFTIRELCLTPKSRAKVGAVLAKQDKPDPLLELLEKHNR